MNNWIISLFALSLMVSCKPKDENVATSGINELAQQYVRLALVIGQYDEPFVDAYYGPDTLKPLTSPSSVFPKDSLLNAVKMLKAECDQIASADSAGTEGHRAAWILSLIHI